MKRIWWIVLGWFIPMTAGAQEKADTIPLFPEHYMARVALFKKEKVIKDKLLFLGDGFIESGKWRKLLKDSSIINLGIKGDIGSGVLLRMNDVLARRPSKVFVYVGADDLYKGQQDGVITEMIFSIAKKIKRGSKNTVVYVQSLLPVNAGLKNFPKGRDTNEHAVIVNSQIQKYAERLGYTYVDLYSEFLDDKGHLLMGYTTDGFNLSPAGYAHWVEILKKKNCL